MLDSSRLRGLLAADAVGTVLAGLLVYVRPAWPMAAADRVPSVGTLLAPRTVRRVGAAVAALGLAKGLLYALVLARDR